MRSIIAALLCIIMLNACKEDPLATMPAFDILLQDSATIFNTANIPEGKRSVIVRFDAHCGDCQKETDSLLMNMDKLKDVNFYFVTTEPFSQVNEFRDFYEMQKYPNITIGKDIKKFTPQHYKSPRTPLLAVYDKNKRLVKIYDGKPEIEIILKQINDLQ